MSKYPRRIKSYGGKQKVLPIKDKKLLNRVMDYWRHLIEHAPTQKKRDQAYRNYMLFLIGFNTAFRAEDLLQLKVKLVIKGYFSIKENKTGKWQHFRINKDLHQEIIDYIKYFDLKENDYLFMGQKKHETKENKSFEVIYPITRQNCEDIIFPKVINACGIDFPFGLHSLRKTFGYQYIKDGGNMLTLQKMYNHDSLDVTLLYVMWDNSDVAETRTATYIGGRKKHEKNN